MSSKDPLKSAISIGDVGDTSLALPSANQYRSGQQRVLDQVLRVRSTKSRKAGSRSGSTSLSPTGSLYDSVFVDTLKSPTNSLSEGVFYGNGSSKSVIQEKSANWTKQVNSVKRSTVKRNTEASSHQYGSFAPVGSKAGGQTLASRSEPDMGWQRSMTRHSVMSPGLQSSRSICRTEKTSSRSITRQTQPQSMYVNGTERSSSQLTTRRIRPRSVHNINDTRQTKSQEQFVSSQVDMSKSVTESTSKSKIDSGSNGNSAVADITMKEALEYLSKDDETFQHCGASYIQHNTYVDDKAKEEVLKLGGIPPLVALLRSPNAAVSQTSSAALRNLSFKNNKSKEEIQLCGGITQAVALLRDTDSVEIQKQVTGLLWNLSSADSLKPDLLNSALPVLMERVILPYTTGPNRSAANSPHPEVFCHATECLRNLSSVGQNNRKTMRQCRGLIDSLVTYIGECVEAEKPDDKSVENCVCILHNLTFQLEAEAPNLFSRITALAAFVNKKNSQGDISPIGCFTPQSKAPEYERNFDYAVAEDPQPTGAGWLIHSKTLQNYLSLLGSSQQEETQEACCGALQNLTANDSIVSSAMSQTIVQKLNGLQVIRPLLKSNKINLQKNTVALLRNLTRNPNLLHTLARKTLPELVGIINESTKKGNESDDTLAMACQTASCLFMKDPDMSKHLVNYDLISSLNDLSKNSYLPKSRKAAALFLYKLWSEKEIQAHVKKHGMNKSLFVNDITTAVHKSVQVID